jgi:hypothetical protein
MGKGSSRRPGTGYADNWERIFGKANNPKELANGSKDKKDKVKRKLEGENPHQYATETC